jgi:hypothetical protein
MEQLRPMRERRPRLDDEPRPEQPAPKPGDVPKDFVLAQSPWIDFSLTSFWMDERTDNFLNVGVQVGGYFVDRIRLSARLVAPVDEATDSFSDYDSQFSSNSQHVDSRSVAVLYGATFGLILSNSKSFLFAPGLSLWRTDVSDYGTTAAFSLPFEWTTYRRLRVGFELALGHSFGGEAHGACTAVVTSSSPCRADTVDREGGTAVLFQYHMGWALSGI